MLAMQALPNDRTMDNTATAPEHSQASQVSRLLRGELSLGKTFWLYFMLPGFCLNGVLKVATLTAPGLPALLLALGVIRLLHIYGMAWLVWINAKNSRSRLWGWLAKAALCEVAWLETIKPLRHHLLG